MYLEERIETLEHQLALLAGLVDRMERHLSTAQKSPLITDAGDVGTVKLIQRGIADFYTLTEQELLSRCRDELHAWPRMIAMYLCRKFTSLSSVAIGRLFNRDHGTVLHAVTVVKNRVSTQEKYRKEVDTWLTHFANQFGAASPSTIGDRPSAISPVRKS